MIERPQDGRHQRDKVFDPIAHRLDYKDCDGQRSEVLLKLEVAVHGEERIEAHRGYREQLAVLDAGPSAALNR